MRPNYLKYRPPKLNSKNFIAAMIIMVIAVIAAVFWFNRPKSNFESNWQNEKENLIRVFSPKPNESVESPIIIKGEARGNWYFEASFPIKLISAQGNLIAVAIAQAQSEWMTEDFVPFKTEINFSVSEKTPATVVFEKDNPSGLPEHADELRIQIFLKP